MPRQRKQAPSDMKDKSRAEEAAGPTSKTTGRISTKAPETSHDAEGPSSNLSRRRRPGSGAGTSLDASLQSGEKESRDMDFQNMSRKSQWLVLAVGSGACAAFNGVFAKLYVFTFRDSIFSRLLIFFEWGICFRLK